jgi:hypothetical protein
MVIRLRFGCVFINKNISVNDGHRLFFMACSVQIRSSTANTLVVDALKSTYVVVSSRPVNCLGRNRPRH